MEILHNKFLLFRKDERLYEGLRIGIKEIYSELSIFSLNEWNKICDENGKFI